MRDLDAFLNSLVNIDRDSLVAILSSEAEAAERLANSIRTRTSTQRLKRQQAVERAARIKRVLLFFSIMKWGRTLSPWPMSCAQYTAPRWLSRANLDHRTLVATVKRSPGSDALTTFGDQAQSKLHDAQP